MRVQTFFLIPLTFQLALGSIHALADGPAPLGSLDLSCIHSMTQQGPGWESSLVTRLDSQTQADLALKTRIAAHLGRHIHTKMGMARLEWMLENPMYAKSDILVRQQALQELIDDPELLKGLQASLKGIEKAAQPLIPEILKNLESKELGPGGKKMAITDLASTVSAYATPFLGQMMFSTGLLAVQGKIIMTTSDKTKEQVAALVRALDTARSFADRLSKKNSPVLREYGAAFGRTDGKTEKNSIVWRTRASKFALQKFKVSGVMDLLFPTGTLRYAAILDLQRKSEELTEFMGVLADLEVLTALAMDATENKDIVSMPEVLDNSDQPVLEMIDGHHPYIVGKMPGKSVANTVSLSANGTPDETRLVLLTGPNAGGKSSFIEMIGVNVDLAQIGGMVYARKMRVTPMQIASSMRIESSMERGQSLFMAQSHRLQEIEGTIEDRVNQNKVPVLVLYDEPFNGTSPEDYPILQQSLALLLASKRGVISVVATQDRRIQSLEQPGNGIKNYHLSDAFEGTPYLLRSGPSTYRNALDVLRDAGVSDEFIRQARERISNP